MSIDLTGIKNWSEERKGAFIKDAAARLIADGVTPAELAELEELANNAQELSTMSVSGEVAEHPILGKVYGLNGD